MKPSRYYIGAITVFGATLALAVSLASAQVDYFDETHFRCYIVSEQTPAPAQTVILSDQFIEEARLTVDEPLQFCAPTIKTNQDGVSSSIDEDEHLTMYAAPMELTPHLLVRTEDQFGPRTLEVVGARVLLVPTQKLVGDLGFPDRLNHYWCYEANGPRVSERVTLDDQFGRNTVRVVEPRFFCNPVEKELVGGDTAGIVDDEFHLTCYEIKGPQKTRPTNFGIFNQLERDTFKVTAFELLCVPSAKLGFTPI